MNASINDLIDREAARHTDSVLDRVRDIGIHRKAVVTPSDPSGDLPGAPDYHTLLSAFTDRAALTRVGGARVPFHARATVVVSPPTAAWVSSFAPKPVSRASVATVQHEPLKVSTILPVTGETLRWSGLDADNELRRLLASAAASAINTKLFSADASSAGVSPAGLAFGLSPATASADLGADILDLVDGMRSPTLIASLVAALRIRNALDGATGLPIVTAFEAGASVYAVDAAAFAFSLGDIEILASEHAAVAMSDEPGSQPANLVSGFQSDTTFLRVTVHADWTATGGLVRVLDLSEGS